MTCKRVCFYGGPGVGKSTLAAAVFAALKTQHYPVELVDEAIKGMAWQELPARGFDTVWLFGKQIRREDIVLRSGGYVISSGPIMMQCYYMQHRGESWAKDLINIAQLSEEIYPSIHLFVDRVVPYKPEGRYEATEEEATRHDFMIRDFLSYHNLKVHRVNAKALAATMKHVRTFLAHPAGPQTH